ncbi:MAG: DNA double-strand break repair Rad50 ATPase [Candidatus Thorarchaeota archaeon AB_25]|nr:MAG: DNA double-strand break repair Rad50 ATPase [Candidatus Thorarchaeota archaeon AB_25]
MKILQLQVRNFKPFSNLLLPEGDAELPDGLILIKGPNSTGKSSLFEAILWGLWGAEAVGLTNDELINFRSTSCQVILSFQVAGTRYKIDRSYDPANKMAVVLFTKRDGAWKRIADKSKSVNSKLDEILSLELKQALSTLLVRQGEVAVIANATPSVLRDLLVKIYDIDLLNQMSSHLESLEKDIQSRIDALESDYMLPKQVDEQIEGCRTRIQEFETGLSQKREDIKTSEKILEKLPDAAVLKKLHELSTNLDSLRREVEVKSEGLKADLAEAGVVDASAQILNARLDALEKGRKRIEKERKESRIKIQALDQEIGLISGTNRDLKEKIEILKAAGADEVIECPTCAKPLSQAERKKLTDEYKATIEDGTAKRDNLEERKRGFVSSSEDFEKQLTLMSKSQDAVKRVSQGQKRVDQAKEKVSTSEQEYSRLLDESGIKNVDTLLKKFGKESIIDLRTEVISLETSLKALRIQISEIESNIQREQDEITKLESKRSEMERIGSEIAEFKNMSEHAKYVRRKLVSGFVTDYVFQKRLLGIIRGATNPYVKSFTNGQYTAIDLEPTAAKGRGGAGLILKIWDERDQAWKKTSQLSFGDRTAISLGLRMGISRTMSSIRPLKDSPVVTPRVRSVLLDEPLGGLDKSRREAVVRNLVNDQSFEQILLITHTDVQGWEGIPVIDVSKTGAASNAVLEM